ncbi:Holliday junction branch migration DNA helicase RuvB [Mycoplasma sp. 3341]|uniref:Holliday junction branch migration DNA helicase RuvB n=1 Tax=Mycoplasma sp. 3341 TaxID=3447506 RepID=UPI003F660B7D
MQLFKISTFDEFIGQDKIKETLKVMIDSADKQHKLIDHLLFYGPPGLGKTSLATIIANETKRNIVFVQGPLLEKRSDLITMFSSIQENDIIFIDEIHSVNKTLHELLYSAMEEGKIDIVLGVDGDKKIMRLKLNNFSLIAATTKFELLTQPLKDRFGYIARLKNYSNAEICKIIENSALKTNMKIDPEAINFIAKNSRFTPRIANNLLKRCHDFTLYENHDVITKSMVQKTFDYLGVFSLGFSDLQIQYLKTLVTIFDQKPASLDAICSLLRESRQTILHDVEPHLLANKFIIKTFRGRMITSKGVDYISQYI